MSAASVATVVTEALPPAFMAMDFAAMLRSEGVAALSRHPVETLQVNLGRRCNQACLHCHVEAGPKRTEVMSSDVAERVVELLRLNPTVGCVDITGGAPEMCPSFRYLIESSRSLGRDVIDRCNLTIMSEDGYGDLGSFLAANSVHVVASLPCYQADNVDEQRGRGVFEKSIAALQLLNSLGYGAADSGLRLDLVYNPSGAFLPPPQERLEAEYRAQLRERHGVEFNNLLTLANMPIKRFAHALLQRGEQVAYAGLLRDNFNGATVPGLMCRSLVSVAWDGGLYDCDFNQMLQLPLGASGPKTVWDLNSLGDLQGAAVATASHCFACTAGAGSSCSGALTQ